MEEKERGSKTEKQRETETERKREETETERERQTEIETNPYSHDTIIMSKKGAMAVPIVQTPDLDVFVSRARH